MLHHIIGLRSNCQLMIETYVTGNYSQKKKKKNNTNKIQLNWFCTQLTNVKI